MKKYKITSPYWFKDGSHEAYVDAHYYAELPDSYEFFFNNGIEVINVFSITKFCVSKIELI